jgi:hypothetical protein
MSDTCETYLRAIQQSIHKCEDLLLKVPVEVKFTTSGPAKWPRRMDQDSAGFVWRLIYPGPGIVQSLVYG